MSKPKSIKLKKTTWKTADDCTNCGHKGMVFHLRSTAKVSRGRTIYIGKLSCPACRVTGVSFCYDSQIPGEARA